MKFDGVRQKVFLDRYALKGEEGELLENTPEEMWRRVAHGIALQEKKPKQKKWEKEFYRVLEDFKFVPGGRILSGAGTGYQVTYFNCFVIPSPKDSRHGILESLGQLIEIQSRSGGVGLNLSSLRPRGARVKKVNGTSSGPVNWATLFSVATHDIVQQGGSRRGATMLMLWDWHPDIEEFITVKQDLTKINGANLSVCVSDEFMEAVKADKPWDLVYPDLSDPNYDKNWDGDLTAWKANGGKVKVYKTVQAKDLWELICTAAWRSAEPGLHFLDRSNKRSNTWYFEKLLATNPSLRAGTRILTKNGIFPIEKLEGQAFLVKNLDGKWSQAKCFLSGRKKPLYKITLNNGREIFATAEHKWPVQSVGGGFGKITTDKLHAGNILPFPEASDISFDSAKPLSREQGLMIGWLYGDGWISERGSNIIKQTALQTELSANAKVFKYRNYSQQVTSYPLLYPRRTAHNALSLHDAVQVSGKKVFGFLFSKEDAILADPILQEINKLKRIRSNLQKAGDNTYTIQTTSSEFTDNLATIFGVDRKEKGFPISVWQSGEEFIKGFVDGLISSDGFIAKKANRIILTTKHKKLAEDFSDLLSFYGIKSNIRRSESELIKFPNGKNYYKTYERYDVSIDGYNAVAFGKIFTLSHPRKQANLTRLVQEFKVSRALPDHELIRVKSVERTDIKEDVWDISVYDDTHCFYINHCVTGNCGEQPLGGWAVCNLGAMNLAAYVKGDDLKNDQAGTFDYESFGQDVQVAMRFLDNVIDDTYYFFKENEKVAKEIRRTGLGIMGIADTFIKMKIRYGSEESEKVSKKIFETLRNNAYIASADIAKEKGSFLKYDRDQYQKGYHIKALPKAIRERIYNQGIRNAVLLTIAPTGTTSLIAAVSSGVEPVYEFEYSHNGRLGKQMVYHGLYGDWKEAHPDSERPDYFVGANDLTPEDHVKIQTVAQEYIDSSISKTVNAPNYHTVEDVKKLYMSAYDKGLKGVTYFRDGSRMGVLQREEKKEEKKEEIVSAVQEPVVPVTPRMPRPMVLTGVTYKANSPTGKLYVTINNNEKGDMFEVFINHGKSGSDLMALADALGRMVSFVLRIHSPVPARERVREIVSELAGIGGSRSSGFGENRVRSLPDAISKVLARHCEFRVNGKVEDSILFTQKASNGMAQSPIHADAPTEEVTANQLALPQTGISSAASTSLFDICPECGSGSFAYEEGCKKCYACGYSEC